MRENSVEVQTLWNQLCSWAVAFPSHGSDRPPPARTDVTVFAFTEWGPDSVFSLTRDFWVSHLLLIYTTTLAKIQHSSTPPGIRKATNPCLCKVLLASVWLGRSRGFLTYNTSWGLVCFNRCIIGFIRKVQCTTGFEASKFQAKEENKIWDLGLNFNSVLIPVMRWMRWQCCGSIIPREERKADLDFYLGNLAYFAVCKSVVLTIRRKKSIPWF